jgi:hypothetical protein
MYLKRFYLKNYCPDSAPTHTLPPISNQTIASKSYTCVLSQGIAIVLFLFFLNIFFHMKQAAHCAKIPFKLNTSLIQSRASHLDACICMGHAHSSIICTHNNLDVTHTLGQVWAKILCPTPTPMCRLVLCEYIFHPDIYPLGMDIIFICIYNLFFSN